MSSRFGRYLTRLGSLANAEASIYPAEAAGTDDVLAIVYRDVPEPGYITGFTYGLSLADHPKWKSGRPELCTTVRSDDVTWVTAASRMVKAVRGRAEFRRGQVVCTVGPISAESDMSCFLVAGPAILGQDDPVGIDVSEPGNEGSDVIKLVGIYPVHAVERDYVNDGGMDHFWSLDWDRFDVSREPAV